MKTECKDCFTAKEAAELLGISNWSVYDYVKAGKLQTKEVENNRVYILADSLEVFLAEREAKSKAHKEQYVNAMISKNREIYESLTEEQKDNLALTMALISKAFAGTTSEQKRILKNGFVLALEYAG